MEQKVNKKKIAFEFILLFGLISSLGDNSWIVTILGYSMLISVPLLALAGNWQIATLFIILERIAKAIRSPGKDTMLSHAAKHFGTGIGFGISEALDQIGGIIEPLIFAISITYMGGEAAS